MQAPRSFGWASTRACWEQVRIPALYCVFSEPEDPHMHNLRESSINDKDQVGSDQSGSRKLEDSIGIGAIYPDIFRTGITDVAAHPSVGGGTLDRPNDFGRECVLTVVRRTAGAAIVRSAAGSDLHQQR